MGPAAHSDTGDVRPTGLPAWSRKGTVSALGGWGIYLVNIAGARTSSARPTTRSENLEKEFHFQRVDAVRAPARDCRTAGTWGRGIVTGSMAGLMGRTRLHLPTAYEQVRLGKDPLWQRVRTPDR